MPTPVTAGSSPARAIIRQIENFSRKGKGMKRPQVKHRFVIEKRTDHLLFVYTSSDAVLVKLMHRFSGFGETKVENGYDTFRVNPCYDVDEVKAYLEETEV